MRRISKIFASAMAFALTVTLVAPTANAAYYDINYFGTQTYDATTNTVNFNSTGYTYTNKISGATYSYDSATGNHTGDFDEATKSYIPGILTNVIVGTDEYVDYDIPLEYGDAMVGNIKLKSGKANITLKKVGTSEESAYPSWDFDAKQYYFHKNDGTKLYVGGSEQTTDEEYKAMKKTRYGYTYRIFGKKPGTAKLQFKYKDIAGKVITKNVKITVTDDARVFTSVTYAGKSLQYDFNKTASNAKNLYAQTTNKSGIDYTTKKSGKFKVKMGKNYKFVTAYVITDTELIPRTSNDTSSYSTTTETYLERRKSGGIDLNNDGDTQDRINGIWESNYDENNVKIIKNGAKVTLGKNAWKQSREENWNNKEGYSTYSKSSYTENMATTTIIVVYQNKATKNFSNRAFTITLRTSK